MKNGIELIYKFNGNIDEGIDVFELSPILLSVGTLIKEAHMTLYPNDREVGINIKPFEKGSFEIDILMFAKTAIDQVFNIFSTDTGKNVKDALVNLGLICSLTGVNFTSLIKAVSVIKGKLKSYEQLESGDVKYTSEEGNSITVSGKVHKLYQNCNIQNNFYPALVKPLELDEVKSVDSFVKNDEKDTKVTIDKSNVPAIKAFSAGQTPCDDKADIVENKRTVWVKPRRVDLEGGPQRWSFRIGPDKLTANITDKDFLQKIKENIIILCQSDRLLVEITEKQTRKGEDILTSNEITSVIKYEKAAEHNQMSLLNSSKEPSNIDDEEE
jgi:hypothetical protein